MDDNQDRLIRYLRHQLAELDARTRLYTTDYHGQTLCRRDVYAALERHYQEFLRGHLSDRWLILTGLRGVGKTTLLMQLLSQLPVPQPDKIYLSVDEITRQLGANLAEVLHAYEQLLGESFVSLQRPVFIFLDEIQYDPNWAATLKSLYDRSRLVFVVATGSAAVNIQSNADVNRRAIFEPIYPLSFPEYIRMRYGVSLDGRLREHLRACLLASSDAREVYHRLHTLEPAIWRYYANFDETMAINHYLQTGTMPSLLYQDSLAAAYDQMKKTVDTIISSDIAALKKFQPGTLESFARLIYVLTNSDVTVVDNIATDLRLNAITIQQMLDTLVLTELIARIWPHGSPGTQVRKASKYLFATPAFRSMYLSQLGSNLTPATIKGKVYEDTVVMYLTRLLTRHRLDFALTYDSAKHGADFILELLTLNKRLSLEVGSGTKGVSQLEATAARAQVRFNFGLAISQSPLAIDPSERFVNIPFSDFLLL